jgi:magnesium transporter
LGYYFISFRAIESHATKEKIQREANLEDPFGTSKSILDDDGPIGAANVYLAVFKDGLCCVCKPFSMSFFTLTDSQFLVSLY